MTGVLSLMHVGVNAGRWMLPWLVILVVSATISFAVASGLTGSAAPAPPASEVRVNDALAYEDAVREVSGRCTSLFGSYNFWLYDNNRRGPCGLAAIGP